MKNDELLIQDNMRTVGTNKVSSTPLGSISHKTETGRIPKEKTEALKELEKAITNVNYYLEQSQKDTMAGGDLDKARIGAGVFSGVIAVIQATAAFIEPSQLTFFVTALGMTAINALIFQPELKKLNAKWELPNAIWKAKDLFAKVAKSSLLTLQEKEELAFLKESFDRQMIRKNDSLKGQKPNAGRSASDNNERTI